jgi:hypothetical protein
MLPAETPPVHHSPPRRGGLETAATQDTGRTIAGVGRRRDGRPALYVFGHCLRYATFGFRGTGRCAAVRL